MTHYELEVDPLIARNRALLPMQCVLDRIPYRYWYVNVLSIFIIPNGSITCTIT